MVERGNRERGTARTQGYLILTSQRMNSLSNNQSPFKRTLNISQEIYFLVHCVQNEMVLRGTEEKSPFRFYIYLCLPTYYTKQRIAQLKTEVKQLKASL